MNRPVAAATSWIFPAAPPERLAMIRILVGAFTLIYVLVRIPAYLALADADQARFEPLGVLSSVPAPFTGTVLAVVIAVAAIAGLCFVAGVGFRLTGPLFALAALFLCSYRNSWGQVLWLENLMVIHVLIAGFSPSADALAWRGRRRRGSRPTQQPSAPAATRSEAYGVPVRLAALVTVASYLLAAIAKIRLAGVDWVASDSLRNHVAAALVRAELFGAPSSPIGRRLVDVGWVFPWLAGAVVALELSAPLALCSGCRRNIWLISIWSMHATIALTMYVVFPYQLFLVAFAPMFELEHLRRARLDGIGWLPRLRRSARGLPFRRSASSAGTPGEHLGEGEHVG